MRKLVLALVISSLLIIPLPEKQPNHLALERSFLPPSLIPQQISSHLTETQYDLELAFPNLSFEDPVGLYHANDETKRLFVVEQKGIIYAFENFRNVTTANIFLDISDRVLSGGEQGLLGLAFHPDFTGNGYFFVDYVANNPRRTVIARFSVSSNNPSEADKKSEEIFLEIGQPYANHNGGQIAFGPDGYLYIALGDGGSAGDPLRNAQDRSTLLGSILRIDVNSQSDGVKYGIPFDNPFVGNPWGYREEIYAYGLRNPWRFSFDPGTGWLWVGDVGQHKMEEIDIIENGKNYGWNTMEGSLCYSPSDDCNKSGLELPIWEYERGLGTSVTGGFVYRGSELTALIGAYIYGDFGSGRIWALWYDGIEDPINVEILDTGINIASFGMDGENELYICAFDGRIYKLALNDISPPVIDTTPEPTISPEPSTSPEPTASPGPTPTPEPTSTPEPEPSPIPTLEPSSSPSPESEPTHEPEQRGIPGFPDLALVIGIVLSLYILKKVQS